MIDATHPYATQASLNAIKASEESGIKYIRFQRTASVTEAATEEHAFVHMVKDMDEAVSWCRKSDRKRILLTTGFSAAEKFVTLKEEKEIYIRILPMAEHIEKCIGYGD